MASTTRKRVVFLAVALVVFGLYVVAPPLRPALGFLTALFGATFVGAAGVYAAVRFADADPLPASRVWSAFSIGGVLLVVGVMM